MLTQAHLKELLHYNSETGIFTWLKSERGGWVGKVAGSVNSEGYLCIKIAKQNLKLHRLAFLYVEGGVPECVDHINRNRQDNRFENLRKATKQQNAYNIKQASQSRSGVRGVSAYRNKFKAELNALGKRYYLGLFASIPEAEVAVRAKRLELHAEFANHE